MQIIETSNAPLPIGPYSQAVIANGMAYLSGQIALHPVTGALVMDDIETETHQVMENIAALLAACGSSWEKVVKASIFLSDMGNFARVNAVYGSYFTGNYPARETVQVACLPKSVNVEISIIALVGA
jgi:2-iminobutanoate/2-iminopropanoate deaminase